MADIVILDADVLIGHLDEHDVHHDDAVSLLLGLTEDGRELGASTITLAEVLVGPATAGRLGDARLAISDLGVGEVILSDGAAAHLAALRAETGRKLPDCCVLLAAESSGATSIATFDERLAGAARRRELGILSLPERGIGGR